MGKNALTKAYRLLGPIIEGNQEDQQNKLKLCMQKEGSQMNHSRLKAEFSLITLSVGGI